MSTAAQQNALMLASLLGVGEAEAAERLKRTVLITAEAGWKTGWAREVGALLSRTLSVRQEPTTAAPDLELVIGCVEPRTTSLRLFAELDDTQLVVDLRAACLGGKEPHGLHAAAAACATVAAAVRLALGAAGLPDVRLPLCLDFSQLGVPSGGLERGVDLTGAVMAGAGAVAHGFLHAARHVGLRGELVIVDPKTVQGGVLNRCIYLDESDVGLDKATALSTRAQPDFPSLRLRPEIEDFRTLVKRRGRSPETVFVTVDSRAARRAVQLEAPHRIVDASTTDVRGGGHSFQYVAD